MYNRSTPLLSFLSLNTPKQKHNKTELHDVMMWYVRLMACLQFLFSRHLTLSHPHQLRAPCVLSPYSLSRCYSPLFFTLYRVCVTLSLFFSLLFGCCSVVCWCCAVAVICAGLLAPPTSTAVSAPHTQHTLNDSSACVASAPPFSLSITSLFSSNIRINLKAFSHFPEYYQLLPASCLPHQNPVFARAESRSS